AGATDEAFMGSWSLKAAGNTLFTMPRIACVRSFVMNHVIHHRAQLGVYLRLNDIPVPSIYGPSADEGM
ncbi:MAG TPA: DinB family protein, partial [Bryobacteraceae bacterium]|nr:DinB family protein [Bryobacteraceae bacterium]